MKARFYRSFAPVWPTAEIALGRLEPPSKHRRYVYDFEDGSRMMVSVEETEQQSQVHFSYSTKTDIQSSDQLIRWSETMKARTADLCGFTLPKASRIFQSTGGVIHVLYQEEPFKKLMDLGRIE